MTECGPESLLIAAATMRGSELERFARLEYGDEDGRRAQTTLLSDFEAMSAGEGPVRHLRQWGARLMGRAARASRRAERDAGDAAAPVASLAAIPSLRPEIWGDAVSPISAAPMGRL